MERIILDFLILVEVSLFILSFIKRSDLKKEKSVVRVSLFILFIILIISPILDWSPKWTMLILILGIQGILGMLSIINSKENSTIKRGKIIFFGLNRVIMIIIALIPAIILPQYEPIKTTGEFSVDTVSYTLIDESREEFFTGDDDKRKLTIQFWYPSTGGKFPLVIFSHGAFGYRLSNYSTYQELASNGYIVCSIDHTYHAFMTNHEDGKVVIANLEFINNAMGAQAGTLSAEEVDKMEDEWMELRTADMSFVMDYIKNMVSNPESDGIFNNIDLDHIGLFGHSLGGATSAQVGRINNDVDAVIVIDGTMLGENRENSPYPKPILNIFNESHYYNEAINNDNYPNTFACKDAPCSYKVVIKGSGHMNFTDLPIISPFLSKMLETEQSTNIDPRFCIEITNDVILQFFNKYLKDIQVEIAKEIIIN